MLSGLQRNHGNHNAAMSAPLHCTASSGSASILEIQHHQPAAMNAGRQQPHCTSSPGEQTASSPCQMHCLAPLLTTISSGLYVSPFSCCSLAQMACGAAVMWGFKFVKRCRRECGQRDHFHCGSLPVRMAAAAAAGAGLVLLVCMHSYHPCCSPPCAERRCLCWVCSACSPDAAPQRLPPQSAPACQTADSGACMGVD